MEGIAEIKSRLAATSYECLPEALEQLREDTRAGVCRLREQYERKYNNYLKELTRLREISGYENACYDSGMTYVAGIDEVGRGPLAGPVVTAAVILPRDCSIMGINDSKKLSAQKREELYAVIMKEAVAVSLAMEDNEVIDRINILQATLSAMGKAVKSLTVRPDMLLVDAVTIPNVDIPQTAIVKGDAKSISIAAASIVAKVTRDRLMAEMSNKYPFYGFEKNMGYGTAMHIEAIKAHGLCPIHRRSFTGGFINE